VPSVHVQCVHATTSQRLFSTHTRAHTDGRERESAERERERERRER
jgi:hypothetical protein